MKCPNCGKNSSSVFKCNNCNDVRCTSCDAIPGKGGRVPGNYNQVSCKMCKKKEVVRIS